MKMKNNKGFTLVELIVVLVILAILAAILVPGLLGYIDQAKEKQYILNAKSCLTAAQAELTKIYAQNSGTILEGNTKENCVINQVPKTGKKYDSKNGDANITDSQFAKSVLDKAGVNPKCLIIGVGSNLNDRGKGTSWNVTEHDKYTVYFVFYLEEKGAVPCIYYNGEWTKKYPRYNKTDDIFNEYNIVQAGPLKGKRIQYYCLVNDMSVTNNAFISSGFWDWIRKYGE